MVSAGDFVELTYVARTKDGRVFDTTDEAEAKKAGIAVENARYGPVLVIAGKAQVLKALDDAVLKAGVGKPSHVDIPKAFGERSDELIRLIPISEFRKRDVEPYPGMVLDVDGRRARVQSVSGGRVRIDLNHELAGQDVAYDFTVERAFTQAADKLAVLLQHTIPGLPADALRFADGSVDVAVSEKWKKDADYTLAKVRFAEQALANVAGVKRVTFHETYAVADGSEGEAKAVAEAKA